MDEYHATIDRGLRLLGWRLDSRNTTEEIHILGQIAEQALDDENAGRLTNARRDELALSAFKWLEFQVMCADERALMTGVLYMKSRYMKPSVPLVDEANLCYGRQYYAATLALLFVIVEQYLLRLSEWVPGTAKPNLLALRERVLSLPNKSRAKEAHGQLNLIYAKYGDPEGTPFGFNRHAVLHGMRDFSSADAMNCARVFLLLDVLVFAEGIGRSFMGGSELDELRKRTEIYGAVVSYHREMTLTRPGDERIPLP